MISNRFSWIALGVGAYLAFLVTMFPASVAYRWFSPAAVRLAGIDGTVWSGSAVLGSVGTVALQNVEWRLRPWSLLIARVGGEIQTRFGGGYVRTRIDAGRSTMTLRDLQATASIEALRAYLPLGDMSGFVSAELGELTLQESWPVAASGEIRLGELSVPPLATPPGTPAVALGNYRILFGNARPDAIVGRFEDQGGPLEVSGTVELTPDRGYVIEGAARARADAPQELTRGLELMAEPPDAQGMRAFSLTGSL